MNGHSGPPAGSSYATPGRRIRRTFSDASSSSASSSQGQPTTQHLVEGGGILDPMSIPIAPINDVPSPLSGSETVADFSQGSLAHPQHEDNGHSHHAQRNVSPLTGSEGPPSKREGLPSVRLPRSSTSSSSLPIPETEHDSSSSASAMPHSNGTATISLPSVPNHVPVLSLARVQLPVPRTGKLETHSAPTSPTEMDHAVHSSSPSYVTPQAVLNNNDRLNTGPVQRPTPLPPNPRFSRPQGTSPPQNPALVPRSQSSGALLSGSVTHGVGSSLPSRTSIEDMPHDHSSVAGGYFSSTSGTGFPRVVSSSAALTEEGKSLSL